MQINLEKFKADANNAQAANKKFLQQLKKVNARTLDDTVHTIHEEVFEETDCLQCANCCKTTGPLYTEKDIERISKHLRMKPADFEAKFLRVDEDNDKVLQNLPCFFLNEDNTCSIYEVRPKACREYPHTDRKKIYQINNLMIKNTVICPAAYEFVERIMKNLGK
jgi:Fe-S-cluster containining protein